MSTVRIKICGLTREGDVDAAVAAGADAIGFVFYPKSPRYVSAEHAAQLIRRLPPFVQSVGLFVNATPADIEQTCAHAGIDLLQFHGDETEADCQRFQRPYLRAARVRPEAGASDLLQFAAAFPSARAILLDAFVDGYGGGGKTFDWSCIPQDPPRPWILSGGLNPDNVAEAVRRVRPLAVDVSSGVEAAKGIKDAAKMQAFVAAVRAVASAGTKCS